MKQISTLLICSLVLSLFSCEKKLPTNIVCLVDFSQTIDTATVTWYKKTISQSILGRMGKRDRVIILPVDFGSQTSSEELFKVDFSKNNYTNEFAGLQSDEVEMKNHQDSVASASRRFILNFEKARKSRINFDNGTDIFGALKQAEKYNSAESKNLIVVFSDMLQYTDRNKMNFENHLNSATEIEKTLALADRADLSSTQIVVLTGIQPDIKPEKFNVVKSFWEKYFQNCNGELIDYSSGAVSQVENIFTQNE